MFFESVLTTVVLAPRGRSAYDNILLKYFKHTDGLAVLLDRERRSVVLGCKLYALVCHPGTTGFVVMMCKEKDKPPVFSVLKNR